MEQQKLVDRYMFINNIPDGDIPLISSAAGGTNFKTFRGLIPGMLSNLNVLNPEDLFRSFIMSSEPDCARITMETVDQNNRSRKETQYVPVTEIKMINPCLFPDRRNRFRDPKAGEEQECIESFQNITDEQSSGSKLPENIMTKGDPIAKFYYIMIGLLVT